MLTLIGVAFSVGKWITHPCHRNDAKTVCSLGFVYEFVAQEVQGDDSSARQ